MLETLIADPAFIAAFFTLIGGISLKMVEKWLGKDANKVMLNQDYREEINELNERLDKEEESTEMWRQKYFTAEEDNHRLRVEMIKNGLNPTDD